MLMDYCIEKRNIHTKEFTVLNTADSFKGAVCILEDMNVELENPGDQIVIARREY